MAEKEYKSCSDCIHYDACYKIEHYGRDLESTSTCKQFIGKNDVAPVVRCKDCVFRGREDCAMFYRCDCGEQHTWETDNDFCSYGARMDGGEGK